MGCKEGIKLKQHKKIGKTCEAVSEWKRIFNRRNNIKLSKL